MTIDGRRIPALRDKILLSVLPLRHLRHRVKSHIVAVVYENQVIKLVVPSKSNSLPGNTLLKTTVTGKRDDMMIKNGVFIRVVTSRSVFAAERVSYGIAHTLSQWTGSSLHPGSFIIFRMARSNTV